MGRLHQLPDTKEGKKRGSRTDKIFDGSLALDLITCIVHNAKFVAEDERRRAREAEEAIFHINSAEAGIAQIHGLLPLEVGAHGEYTIEPTLFCMYNEETKLVEYEAVLWLAGFGEEA